MILRAVYCLIFLFPLGIWGQQTFVVTDENGEGTGTTTWEAEHTYILNGPVYVNPGDVLTIEPGTVIKGRYNPTIGQNAMLIVSPGAQIIAEGTASLPIIFTSEGDDPAIVGPSNCTRTELTYISDIEFESTNGWGPVERDQSNGETRANDGPPIQMGGRVYVKGLGVHASDPDPPNPFTITDTDISRVIVDLDGEYDIFRSDIGAQDTKEFNLFGQPTELSIEFVVVVDGITRFSSGLISAGDPVQFVEVDVSGAQQLELQVLNGGPVNESVDGNRKKADHGNWGSARLLRCTNDAAILQENIEPTAFDNGLWGGLVVLGNAPTNAPTETRVIAGLLEDKRNTYGGNALADNSGSLKYVSIRHGGGFLNEADDIKANALTLAGVGNRTVVEHIDVISSFDDGIEVCGGTVNLKWLSMAFCGDDGFDIDQGYQGRGQFWFSIQNPDADIGISHDGGDRSFVLNPITQPAVFNATIIGGGVDGSTRFGMIFADQAAGRYANSIFSEFNSGVQIEYRADNRDSYSQFLEDQLELRSNIFWNIGFVGPDCNELIVPGGDAPNAVREEFKEYFERENNIYNNPVFAGFNESSYTPGKTALYPVPASGGFAYRELEAIPSGGAASAFFDQVSFKGAFGEDMWIERWTGLSAYGFLGTSGGNANPNTRKADLGASNISSLPDELEPGQGIELSFNLVNDGVFASGNFNVEVFLESSDAVLASRDFQSLKKGESINNITFSITIPESANASDALILKIDTAEQVEESNETNNTVRIPFELKTPALPDLRISNLSVSPNPAASGSVVTVNFDVSNEGEASSDAIPVQLEIGGTVLSPAPAPLANLDPGASRTISRNLTIPEGVPGGALTLAIILDPSNIIQETNEGNNRAEVELEILDALPDLSIRDLSVEVPSVQVGELFFLTFTAENRGEAESGPIEVLVRLSTGEIIATNTLSSLPGGGESSLVQLQVAIPASVTASEVTVEVVLDSENKIIEENEENNVGSIELEVISTQRMFPDLTLEITEPSSDTLIVTAGQAFLINMRIGNSGDSIAAASQIRLTFDDRIVDTIAQPELPVLSVRIIENRSIFIPSATAAGFYPFVAKVDAKEEWVEKSESNNSDTLIVIVKEGVGGEDLSIAQTSFPAFHTMREGVTSSPSITVSHPDRVSRVEFAHKPISASLDGNSFQVVELEVDNSSPIYSADFTDSDVGPIGISYVFRVFGTNGEEVQTELGHTHLRYNEDGLTLPSIRTGDQVQNYQILSIPLNLDNKTVQDVFIDDIGSDEEQTRWRLMQFNGTSTQDVSATSSVLPGRGYWLLTVNSATIDTGPGTTVQATETDPVSFSLTTQHTQVGNPYNFPILWEDILTANENPEGLTLTTYNNGYTEDTRLDAFEGGFIQSNATPISLEIPVFKNPSVNRIAKPSPNPIDHSSWYLPFFLEAGALVHQVGGIGMAPTASTGLDLNDVEGFPRFDSYLDFYFPEANHPYQRMAKNYISPQPTYTWDMVVSSNLGEPIKMSWENDWFGDNERQLWLEDLQTGRVYDMREEKSVQLSSEVQEGYFRVHFGDLPYVQAQVQGLQVHIGAPSPNPFNDRLIFPIFVPSPEEDSRVYIRLYNLIGKEVASREWTLDQSQMMIKWGLSAEKLPPAIYLYKIEVQTSAGKQQKWGRLLRSRN